MDARSEQDALPAPPADAGTEDGDVLIEGRRTRFFRIHDLNLGVRPHHMITYYLATVATISFLVFINASQGVILEDMGIQSDSQGRYTGDLAFYNELMVIATSAAWGSLSDKIGRRLVYAAGYLIIGAALFLYPFPRSFTLLVVVRLLFAAGAASAASMTSAVLGDYVIFAHRGLVSGLVGFAAGLGALFALGVYLNIPWAVTELFHFSQVDGTLFMYMIVSLWSLLCCFFLLLGLQRREESRITQKHASILQILKDGFFAGRNPIIAAGFGARGDSVLVSVFLSLWVSNAAFAAGHSSSWALTRAGVVSGIAQTCAILFAPVSGYMIQKLNRVFALVLLSLTAAFGYILIFFYTDPLDWGIAFPAAIIGCGEIGLVVSSTALVAQDAPPQVRGAVSGFWALCGSIGILVATKLGGLVFDKWRPGAAFLFFGILNLVLALWAGIVWATHERFNLIPPAKVMADVTSN